MLLNVDVLDVERAVAFYVAAFGFSVGRVLGDDFVELLGAGVPLYLLKKGAGTPPFAGSTTTRSYQRHWSPVHIDIVVDDLDAGVIRATAAGAVSEGGISQHSWGRMQLLADPFGHGVCLLEMSALGYDALSGRSGELISS